LDKYLLHITRHKRYWENKRTAIRQKEKKLEQMIAQYSEDAEQLRSKRRDIIDEARNEARKILDSSNAAIERTIADIKQANAERERTLEARRKLKEERLALEKDARNHRDNNAILSKAPKKKKRNGETKQSEQSVTKAEIAVGTNVKLDGAGTVGTVLEISGKNAIVAFGNLKTNVKLDRLTATNAQPKSGAKSTVSMQTIDSGYERQLNFKQEIDLRGMRADEAIQAVTYFIDDAIRFSIARVRILHGTGTGALRQAIRSLLSTTPGIESFHDEDVRFGGAGITVVNLK
ncbi:MAG: Smr/MutS family protein, partial [Duncaniella sp.]|nr:Smr/MutS family protein [Duncaniella sp.]